MLSDPKLMYFPVYFSPSPPLVSFLSKSQPITDEKSGHTLRGSRPSLLRVQQKIGKTILGAKLYLNRSP